MTRVAVMQPYFFPYAGYFRLMALVDQFVILDCVQFPRRGRVHRSEVARHDNQPVWLTLPLARQPRDTRICEVAFAADARPRFDERLEALSWVRSSRGADADRVRSFLFGPLDSPLDYLESGLRLAAELLGITVSVTRSSSLRLAPSLRGQDRILAVVAAAGATHYLNAPGGRSLYDAETFHRHNVQLEFLEPYDGEYPYLLPALMTGAAGRIRADVMATARIAAASGV
jgi:hypothetical protein